MPKPAKCVSSERQQVYQNQFKKTVICRFFLADACKKGNKCTFAHSVEELQDVPDLRKTALCKLWKRGLCTLSGDRCPFAHNKRELRLSPAFAQLANRKRPETATVGAGTPSTASTLSPDLSEGSSQSSGSQPPSPRQKAEACSGGTQQPTCRVSAPPPPKARGGSRKKQTGSGAAGPANEEQSSHPTSPSNKAGQTARVPAPPGLLPESASEAAGVKVVLAAAAVPASQPAETRADLEPAFVQIPAFCSGGGARLAAAPVEDVLDAHEPQALEVTAGGSDPRPVFVSLQTQQGAAALPTPSFAQVPRMASTDWLKGPTTQVSGPAGLPAHASQCHVMAARQAAELRAIASEAEMKAAAFAQEAALLKQRAETAERELMLAARSAVVTLAGRLGEGEQGSVQ